MQFYGMHKCTLLDYPEEVAATLFTKGCNFRCPYCHNPELVHSTDNLNPISWDEIKNFLTKRKNLLGGVCITGGEPLLHDELPKIIDEIKDLGFKVKIDTNGSLPDKLKKIKADYIAMDIKTSIQKYKLIGYTEKGDLSIKIKKSIEWIINSNITYEFRTTVVPDIVTKHDIEEIAKLLKSFIDKNKNPIPIKYALAQFRPMNTLDKNWGQKIPYSISILEDMKKIVEGYGFLCEIRAQYAIKPKENSDSEG